MRLLIVIALLLGGCLTDAPVQRPCPSATAPAAAQTVEAQRDPLAGTEPIEDDDALLSFYDSPQWRELRGERDYVPFLAHATDAGVYVHFGAARLSRALDKPAAAKVARVRGEGHNVALLRLGGGDAATPKSAFSDRAWEVYDGSTVVCTGRLGPAERVSYVRAWLPEAVACLATPDHERDPPASAFARDTLFEYGGKDPRVFVASPVAGCRVDSRRPLWARPVPVNYEPAADAPQAFAWTPIEAGELGAPSARTPLWQLMEARVRRTQRIASNVPPNVSAFSSAPAGSPDAPGFSVFLSIGENAYTGQDYASVWDLWSPEAKLDRRKHLGRVVSNGVVAVEPVLTVSTTSLQFVIALMRAADEDELVVFQHTSGQLMPMRSLLIRGSCLD